MNPVLQQLYAEGRVRDAEGRPGAEATTSVQEGSGRLLYDLVRREGLARTAEVGLAYGASALFICQALAENGGGLHTAMDPAQVSRFERLGVLNVERAGLAEHFRWFEGPSHAVFPTLVAEGERFDLVFIDGNHTFDHVLVDFFYADQLVPPGGFVAFDDLWMPGILRAVNYVLRNRAYDVVPAPGARYSGWGRRAARALRRLGAAPLRLDGRLRRYTLNSIVLRKTADDTRRWDFHRPF